MPAAYQHAIGNGYVQTTFHSPFYNISGDPSDRLLGGGTLLNLGRRGGGNGNTEFPWNVAPGGAHNSPSVNSFKGLALPADESGRLKPVVWFRQDLPGRGNRERIIRAGGGLAEGRPSDSNYGYGWTFPVGATLIEALTMTTPAGDEVVFEVRFRVRETDAWGVDIYRPFPTGDSLADAIEELGPGDARRAQAVAELRAPQRIRPMRLADDRHRKKRAFDVTAGVCPLPQLSTGDVLTLLDRPFESCLGEQWKTGANGADAIVPTNPTDNFNLVPPNFQGAFAGNTRNDCMNCHDSANRHVTEFEQPRGWYGRIRGSDGIFSFHPIDPESISYTGGLLPVRIRQSLVDAGVVAEYDPAIHSPNDYRRIRGLY